MILANFMVYLVKSLIIGYYNFIAWLAAIFIFAKVIPCIPISIGIPVAQCQYAPSTLLLRAQPNADWANC